MNRKQLPYVVAGVAGVVVVGILIARSSAAGVDDGRPIHVAGDSYAVGISGALRKLYPGRLITSDAVGGVAAAYMPTLQERDGWTILSAGTNDAAGPATPATIADRIVRVLGTYGSGAAKRGAVAFIVPHSKMGPQFGELGARVTEAVGYLYPKIEDRPRIALVSISETPGASDTIHFTPEQYAAIGARAVQALADLDA